MASNQVFADEVIQGPNYIDALAGYSFPDKSLGTTGKGFTVSGIFGHELPHRFALEVNIQSSTFETGVSGGTDYYQNGGTVDLAYALGSRATNSLFMPFVLVGAGAVYDDLYPNTRDGAAFIADAGVGIVTKPLFSNGIRLRIDARYVHDAKEGGHGEPRAIAGIEIPLGRVVRVVEIKTETHEVVREVIKDVVRPWVDSDGDGVDDEHDRCPDTPRGMKVDATGCVIENQSFSLQGVTFEYNKARLTPNAQSVLDLVSRAFAGQPSLKVQIAGHTDSRGSVAANQTLSQQRAESVRRYFIGKGVAASQLTAQGYGKSQLLITPETSDQDRERNRRVELRVTAR